MKSLLNESTSRYDHRHKKHANRSYGEKGTSIERFAHRRKYKTFSFGCFNYIKTYIRYFIDIII